MQERFGFLVHFLYHYVLWANLARDRILKFGVGDLDFTGKCDLWCAGSHDPWELPWAILTRFRHLGGRCQTVETDTHKFHFRQIYLVSNVTLSGQNRHQSLSMYRFATIIYNHFNSKPISRPAQTLLSVLSTTLSSGENFMLTLLTQCRSSVGVGYPSPLKTWPKWPPQFEHTISVLSMPNVRSVCRVTAPGILSKYAGHPQPDLNLWEALYRGASQAAQV